MGAGQTGRLRETAALKRKKKENVQYRAMDCERRKRERESEGGKGKTGQKKGSVDAQFTSVEQGKWACRLSPPQARQKTAR